MTATIKTEQPKVSVNFPLPINSVAEGTAFLVMERCAGGVLIRTSRRYGSRLNPFWQVWLRHLLLKAPAKYQLAIKLKTKGVRVTSPLPVEDWVWAIANLAAGVIRLGEPPIKQYHYRGEIDEMRWLVHPYADLTDIVDNISLPDTVTRYFTVGGGLDTVKLDRYGRDRRDCMFTIKEVRMMVEWQIALACHTGGVPLSQCSPSLRGRDRRAWRMPRPPRYDVGISKPDQATAPTVPVAVTAPQRNIWASIVRVWRLLVRIWWR